MVVISVDILVNSLINCSFLSSGRKGPSNVITGMNVFILRWISSAKITEILNSSRQLYRFSLFPYIYINRTAMKPDELNILASSFGSIGLMPLLFVGHGSPMNAIEDNIFSKEWMEIGTTLPKPNAILCISAHWETRGVYITAMKNPRTIHDFGGFPQELFEVQYPAPGNPELAWFHYELGRELVPLRKKGVLIIGSGNMVHNLHMVAWDRMDEPGFGYDWAIEANEKMKELILSGDHNALINYRSQGKAFDLSIPTPEHFLPLLYTLGLKEEKEQNFNYGHGTGPGHPYPCSLGSRLII